MPIWLRVGTAARNAPHPKPKSVIGEFRDAVAALPRTAGAFSGDVATGSAKKMRPSKESRALLRSPPIGKRSTSRLIIGGKSMGGRVASMLADELFNAGTIAGLVCLGYPFHPPNTPQNLRTAHLERLACPTLIVQGERDPFGTRAEVQPLPLSPAIAIHWIGDGDHDLGPRGASGFTRKGNLAAAAEAIQAFAEKL